MDSEESAVAERMGGRKSKLGSGGRFAALSSKLAKGGAKNPDALAAFIGRKKFGKARFAELAARGHRGK